MTLELNGNELMSAGRLVLVSIGPGFVEHISAAARLALQESDAVVGYNLYLDWIAPILNGQKIYPFALTQERERALKSIELARSGKSVSLVSSGDIGIYAMASLVFEELGEADRFEVRVLPGITAANACASLIGAPLSHDFATLSLSDLLCPWSIIEKRARHIGSADLCLALYNVQSEKRQVGVYEVVRILLEEKRPDTICGVVKNAYRPDQSVAITTLAGLLDMKFDMFTTIIIGNQHTKRKGEFIYTDRGYSGGLQTSPAEATESGQTELPSEAIWVFSGTSDGNELANEIIRLGHKVVLSVATKYGAGLARRNCPGAHLVIGGSGVSTRKKSLQKFRARAIVDATHPYSVTISEQLIKLSNELKVSYVRFDRPSHLRGRVQEKGLTLCENVEEAAERAMCLGKRIFLSTGSKDLATILETAGASERTWFARVTPDPQSIMQAVAAGIPFEQICAMQGPFSPEFNESLWKEWEIDCLVTKDSGIAGGYESKMKAARKLKIPVVVVKRPSIDYPRVVSDVASVVNYLFPSGVEND